MRHTVRTRENIARLLTLTGLVMVFALIVAACGGDDPTPTPVPKAAPAPTATPVPAAKAAPTAEPKAAPKAAPKAPAQPKATPTPSFDAVAHFKGKTIRILVGSNPGGGTDASARWIAKGLGKFVPGNPRFIVSNLPAIAAMNATWKSDPDGLVMVELARTYFDSQMERGAKYDLSKVRTIGTTAPKTQILSVAEHAPYLTLKDAMGATGKPFIHSAELTKYSDLTGGEMIFAWLCDKLAIPCKIVPVVDASTGQDLLMLQRKEVNSFMHTDVSWYGLPKRNPGLYESGFLRGLADLTLPGGLQIEPNIPGGSVPTNIWPLLTKDDVDEYNRLFGPDLISAKLFWLTAETPQPIVDVLRNAFINAAKDKEFVTGLNRLLGQDVGKAGMWDADFEDRFHVLGAAAAEHGKITAAHKQRLFNKFVVR